MGGNASRPAFADKKNDSVVAGGKIGSFPFRDKDHGYQIRSCYLTENYLLIKCQTKRPPPDIWPEESLYVYDRQSLQEVGKIELALHNSISILKNDQVQIVGFSDDAIAVCYFGHEDPNIYQELSSKIYHLKTKEIEDNVDKNDVRLNMPDVDSKHPIYKLLKIRDDARSTYCSYFSPDQNKVCVEIRLGLKIQRYQFFHKINDEWKEVELDNRMGSMNRYHFETWCDNGDFIMAVKPVAKIQAREKNTAYIYEMAVNGIRYKAKASLPYCSNSGAFSQILPSGTMLMFHQNTNQIHEFALYPGMINEKAKTIAALDTVVPIITRPVLAMVADYKVKKFPVFITEVLSRDPQPEEKKSDKTNSKGVNYTLWRTMKKNDGQDAGTPAPPSFKK